MKSQKRMMEFLGDFRIVGVGGSGCHAVSLMGKEEPCDYVAMNTDAAALLSTDVPNKVLLGKTITRGMSTGNDMSLGERAAQSSSQQIASVLAGSKVTFIVAEIGGGTGAGASLVVAQLARSLGSIVISFVTLPFKSEGKTCKSNAIACLKGLRPFSDLTVVIENDRFLHTVIEKSLTQALKAANHMVLEAVMGFANIIHSSKIDDIRPILSGYATLGYGVGDCMREATFRALNSPLIGADITRSLGAILIYRVGSDTPDEADECMGILSERTGPSASIVWTKQKTDVQGCEALIIFTGVSSPYICETK